MTTGSEATSEIIAGLVARLEQLEAVEAIRDVMFRYARGADRGDIDLFKSCYWPDATDCHWFWNGNAHEFADYVIPLLREIPNSQHSITNPIIEIDGDRAFAECQWYVLHHIQLDDERFIDQQCEGRYLDVFERRDGEWKILHRQTAMEALREHVTANLTRDYPPLHPALGQRAPHDAVYRGAALADDEIYQMPPADLWGDARARHAGS